MRPICFSVLFIFLLHSTVLWGQEVNKDEIKNKFMEAESWLLFEEYPDALPYYLELLALSPDNDNLNYRIGVCYLSIPGEKQKAIGYLEKAVRNLNPKYREGSLKETQAPTDAYFYLGHAYRINNQLDKALDAYKKFKEQLDPKLYDEQLVDEQIQACLNAKKLQNEPLFIEYANLGDPVNSRFSDFNPIVSGDESVMVFTRELQFYDAVMFSRKVDGQWTEPVNMTEQLGFDRDFFSSSLSYDGKELYLYKNDNYDGNIYTSTYSDGIWSPVKRLNDNINTKYWESHASVSRDGKTLYFTSNRKGGIGYLDIYKSERDITGDWGPAVNLGPKINTPYNEETPFICEDGKTLYFSSYGHFNIGGYDIFYSTLLENGEWSAPLNMGYPINTTDDDYFFTPVQNGIFGYYARFTDEGLGRKDIYRFEIFSDEHPRKFLIHGMVPLQKVKGPYGAYKIILLSAKGDTLQVIRPDPKTGEYAFEVIAGNYRVVFENEGYESYSKNISFTKNQETADLNFEPPDLILKDITAEIDIKNTLYTVTTGDPLDIKVSLEKDSRLSVTSFRNNALVNTEQFDTPGRDFTYTYTPAVGKNIIRFDMTDPYGNLGSKEVVIEYIPVIARRPVQAVPEVAETTEVPGTPGKDDILQATGEGLTRLYRDDPEKARQELFNMADGNLKTILGNLDLDAAQITTLDGLLDYLFRESEEAGYSPEEIQSLADQLVITETGDLTNLLSRMRRFATGELKKALDELDPSKEAIFTTEQLFDYLVNNAARFGYSEEEITDLLIALGTGGHPDIIIYVDLLSVAATENLARALADLDLAAENIQTPEDLVNYLASQASRYGYTPEELNRALLALAASTGIDEEALDRYLAAREEGRARGASRWFLWIVIPAGAILLWLVIWNRRKRKE